MTSGLPRFEEIRVRLFCVNTHIRTKDDNPYYQPEPIMRHRHAAILLVVTLTLVMLLGTGAARADEDRWSQDAAEPSGSYMYTDPDTGRTLLVPRKHLPKDYQPPPSTGPCDEEVEALAENWRGNAKFLVVGLAVLGGACGLFVLVEGSSR
jgi:hypothetical protein